jgi:hypothetical protein
MTFYSARVVFEELEEASKSLEASSKDFSHLGLLQREQ